ncbi:MAG: hypothetical protein IKZ01_01310 [Anaerotignum sp.]|nr:hypothetical protein [Anaerotignum sp.]MBR5121926.1 hypothetical protein [Anaerotignum sp.]
MKKRLFALSMAIILSLCCIGCGSSEPEAPAEEQKIEEPVKDERGITGSKYTDICDMMSAMGFPKHDVNYLPEEDLYLVPYCTAEDVYSYAYGISFTDDYEIIDASFSMANINLKDGTTFLKDTITFFTVGTAFSYDTLDHDKLMKWLEDNTNTLEDVEIVIGDAKYSMYTTVQDSGLATARSLYIEKAK